MADYNLSVTKITPEAYNSTKYAQHFVLTELNFNFARAF